MISNTNHDSSEGEQWGRYNLPRIYMYIHWLVVLTILKNMSSSMGRIIPYIMENRKCSKPPTSIYVSTCILGHIVDNCITNMSNIYINYINYISKIVPVPMTFVMWLLLTWVLLGLFRNSPSERASSPPCSHPCRKCRWESRLGHAETQEFRLRPSKSSLFYQRGIPNILSTGMHKRYSH